MSQPSRAFQLGQRLTYTRRLFNCRYFTAFHVYRYIPMFPAAEILSRPSHPLYYPTRQRYDAAPQKGLWYCVSSELFTNSVKACVRVRRRRRVKSAFWEALQECGYNKEGLATQNGALDLRGSLSVCVKPGTEQAPWKDLKDASRELVKTLEKKCALEKPNVKSTPFYNTVNWQPGR